MQHGQPRGLFRPQELQLKNCKVRCVKAGMRFQLQFHLQAECMLQDVAAVLDAATLVSFHQFLLLYITYNTHSKGIEHVVSHSFSIT